MLRADSLSFAYAGDRTNRAPTWLLRDVALEVPTGSFTGLIGPNGCGKTTLLRLCAGMLRPDRGVLTLDGQDVTALPRRALARRLAVVPQATHPVFDYTAMEMVLMGRHPHLGRFQFEGPDDLRHAERALAATGTSHLAHRTFGTLSGGEQQRVVIAAALVQATDVLLLDEPTASLDLGYQLEVASLLAALNRDQGITMLMATHDLNLAASVCDRLILLRDGHVLAQGPTRDVLTDDAVRALYGVDVDIVAHERSGRLVVLPVRPVR
ncbi:MAG: ABC transporter ATP-binding protein [Acidobacteria bacterium]|nr:ABC transporter ATP-binding protein [Acidobacteriota bacterium]